MYFFLSLMSVAKELNNMINKVSFMSEEYLAQKWVFQKRELVTVNVLGPREGSISKKKMKSSPILGSYGNLFLYAIPKNN
jgi:hypothetical protein